MKPHTALFLLSLAAALASCATRREAAPVILQYTTRDTLAATLHTRDSIHTHDSIHVTQRRSGDTVYLTRERWHTTFRERSVHDTVYVAHHDTVPRPVPVIRERRPTLWQRLRPILVGIPLGALLLGLLLMRLRR